MSLENKSKILTVLPQHLTLLPNSVCHVVDSIYIKVIIANKKCYVSWKKKKKSYVIRIVQTHYLNNFFHFRWLSKRVRLGLVKVASL